MVQRQNCGGSSFTEGHRRHFGLGDCHASWVMLGRESPEPYLEKSRTALEAAIRLEPGLADAHAALALVEAMFEWNWASAESRFQTALALSPRSAAHICNLHGAVLAVTGRLDEAIATYRRAMELDPLGPLWNACFGQALLGTRDWGGAIRQANAALDLVPDYWFALQVAGQAHVASGNLDEGIATFERAVTASAEAPHTIGLLENALGRAGRRRPRSHQGQVQGAARGARADRAGCRHEADDQRRRGQERG